MAPPDGKQETTFLCLFVLGKHFKLNIDFNAIFPVADSFDAAAALADFWINGNYNDSLAVLSLSLQGLAQTH